MRRGARSWTLGMAKKLFKPHVILSVLFSLLVTSCFLNYSQLFSENITDETRGYTTGELKMFIELAHLATIDYQGLDSTPFESIKGKVKYAVQTDVLEYTSTYGPENIQASAGLVFPKVTHTGQKFPLLISMHHTLLRDVEAPSYLSSDLASFDLGSFSNFEPNLHPLLIAGGIGFVVYQPDMLGFGSSKDRVHPFTRNDYLMSDLFSGMEAVIKEMADRGIQVDTQRIFISGYSHGGWVATRFYRYLNENYASTYKVVAGVSSAGIYDFQNLVEDLLKRESSSLPLFLPYMIYGYIGSGTITGLTYADFFKGEYANLDFAGDLFNGEHDNGYVDNKLSSKIAELYNASFIANYNSGSYLEFWNRIGQDSIVPWGLSGELNIIHHTGDKVIPVAQVNSFISDMNNFTDASSQRVNANKISSKIGTWGAGSEHEATAIQTYIHGLYWLSERM